MDSFTFKVLMLISLRGHNLDKNAIDKMKYDSEIEYLFINGYIEIITEKKKQWYITTLKGEDVADRFCKIAELIS